MNMFGKDTEMQVIPHYHLKWRSVRGHKQTWYGTVYDERGVIAAIRRYSQTDDGIEGKVQMSDEGVVQFKTKNRVYMITPISMDTGHQMEFTDIERDLMDTMRKQVHKKMEGSQ